MGDKEYEEAAIRLSDINPFIAYLENTREEDWQVDIVRSKDGKKNCVMGHLINWFYGEGYEGSVMPAWDTFEEMWATTWMIYPVNDGRHREYQQATPKQRCIAYLEDLRDGRKKTTAQLIEEYENPNINT